MVDKILAQKEDSDDYLSGDEQPKKPLFQITTGQDEESKGEVTEETHEITDADEIAEMNS
jgi:hypothetical protein